MDNYAQRYGTPPMGTIQEPSMTLDKTCKLLRAAKPMVWAIAIVVGLLGVTLIIRYLWRRPLQSEEEQEWKPTT